MSVIDKNHRLLMPLPSHLTRSKSFLSLTWRSKKVTADRQKNFLSQEYIGFIVSNEWTFQLGLESGQLEAVKWMFRRESTGSTDGGKTHVGVHGGRRF